MSLLPSYFFNLGSWDIKLCVKAIDVIEFDTAGRVLLLLLQGLLWNEYVGSEMLA
jgi:hypothetical protein